MKKFIAILTLIFLFLGGFVLADAATTQGLLDIDEDAVDAPQTDDLPTGAPITLQILRGWMDAIQSFLIYAGITIVIIMLAASGIMWAIAGGETKNVDKAKGMLKGAIYGGLIILGINVILATISFIVGQQFFE